MNKKSQKKHLICIPLTQNAINTLKKAKGKPKQKKTRSIKVKHALAASARTWEPAGVQHSSSPFCPQIFRYTWLALQTFVCVPDSMSLRSGYKHACNMNIVLAPCDLPFNVFLSISISAFMYIFSITGLFPFVLPSTEVNNRSRCQTSLHWEKEESVRNDRQ